MGDNKKSFSVIGYKKEIYFALIDAGLDVRPSIGRYKGQDEACIIVYHVGPLNMERVRRSINNLAFRYGEESVLHYNFETASLEFSDGSWLIAQGHRSSCELPGGMDFVKLGSNSYSTFFFPVKEYVK